jgi:hypothetical protein
MNMAGSFINVVPNGTRVQVLVQFAKIVNGRWQYSPNGAFEYATHHSQLNGVTMSSGSSWVTSRSVV